MAGKPGRSGGLRNGAGRPKGIPNKATIEKAMIAGQIAARAEMQGRKLAKEVLDEFMHLFAEMAASAREGGDETRFEKWARLAVQCAKDLAAYQSPTLRAIMVAPNSTDGGAIRFIIDAAPPMIEAVAEPGETA